MTNSKIVALKQVRISPEERQNGVPITALREISILRSLKHQNVINVVDVAVQAKAMDEIYMVMEYAEQVGDPMLRGVIARSSLRICAHLSGLSFLRQLVGGAPRALE